jgi:hypothetical protein
MMTMGGEHEMDTGSFAGTDVSSRSGQQYPDMSSNIDGMGSLAEDDMVHVDARGDKTSVPCGNASCPPSTPEPSIQAHLANSIYGELIRLITSIGIPLGQNLPQVCRSGSTRVPKWALALQGPLLLISDMYCISPYLVVGGPCRRRVTREVEHSRPHHLPRASTQRQRYAHPCWHTVENATDETLFRHAPSQHDPILRFTRPTVAYFCAGMTTRCPIRLCLKHDPKLTTQRIYLPPLKKGGKRRCDTHTYPVWLQ